MSLRERVQAILWQPDEDEEDRVHRAIEEIAGDVDRVSSRLAVIDPEWEVITRLRNRTAAARRDAA